MTDQKTQTIPRILFVIGQLILSEGIMGVGYDIVARRSGYDEATVEWAVQQLMDLKLVWGDHLRWHPFTFRFTLTPAGSEAVLALWQRSSPDCVIV